MGRFSDRSAEANRLLQAAVQPQLRPGEPLIGVVHANEQKTFSAKLYAVGVTPDRIILQPVDRKWAPAGDPRSITRSDVVGCSVWGWGGSVASWLSTNADQQIRIETADFKVKLMVLGGNVLENAPRRRGPAPRPRRPREVPALDPALIPPPTATRA